MSFENYDPYFPDQPVVDQYLPVWANLPSFRSKPAFIWAEDSLSGSLKCSSLTYEGLNNSVHSISSQLLQSFQRGDTFIILCSPGLELVEILFGCQRAGLIGVPIIPPNPSFSNNDHHHLIRVLSQTRPKAAVADQGYIEKVERYIKLSCPGNPLSNMLRNLEWIPMENLIEMNVTSNKRLHLSYQGCKPDEVYLVQYTSGATGIPKPVLVTAGAAAHNVRLARKSYDLHPNSIITSWLPQYHDCGLMFLLLTIVSGATCVLTSPKAFISRPRLWLELITKFKATCTPVPSFTLPLVVKRGQVFDTNRVSINLATMKNLIIINEPIYDKAIKQFVEVFRPFGLNPSSISPSYGLAENCTFVSTAWRSKVQGREISDFPIYKKLLPSARLDDIDDEEGDIDIIIVNEETNELVEDGFEGEIWIASSPSKASGYLSHPSLTQEVFHSRLRGRFSHERFIRTGDRGIIKGVERFLFVTGRCVDAIKRENGVETHAHYLETAAYASCTRFLRGGCIAAFEINGTTTAIVAEMQKTGENEESMLRSICEGIREFVMKEHDILLEMIALVKSGSIPKTTSGKIQRWLAKDIFLRGNMEVVKEMKFDKEDDKNRMINQSESRKTILYSNL
ncbi:hypothetical protein L1987_66552 [Smallanthus sonchifolius]|uniref:Uncharacterized protein n=1 Tax=Smallanthus sonchifolius TaxID=185202 RepID=A0ACB9BXK8_9ASTR|nr:hypothetical protein L1987_66552 [Smallanthus sonchifolius]